MADLNAILNTIQSAVYGRDVRQGIYDGIKFIHDEYMTIQDVAQRCKDLLDIYEQAVADAKRLSSELSSLNTTAEGYVTDLTDLESTLSDGRQVLAELKTENGKATTNIQTAEEKIRIIQSLLDQFPDLDESKQIATRLENAYNNAVEAVGMIGSVEEAVRQLTEQNTDAHANIEAFNQAKTDMESLNQTVQAMSEQVADYPDLIQRLDEAYNEVKNSTIDMEELRQLLADLESNVAFIDENKESINTVAQSIDVIKQFIEMGGVDFADYDARLRKMEEMLDGVQTFLDQTI